MVCRLARPRASAPSPGQAERTRSFLHLQHIDESPDQLLHLMVARRLAVDADERLGTAESNQGPTAIVEVELEPVVRAHPLDLAARDLGGRIGSETLVDATLEIVVAFPGNRYVATVVGVGANPLEQRSQDRREWLFLADDHVGKIQTRQYAVALGDVAAEAEAA